MSAHAPLQAVEDALAAVEAALAAGDAEAARLAAEAGAAACRALGPAGPGTPGAPRPTSAQLDTVLAAHARALATAEATRAELARALEQTGRSRRAAIAYGRR